MKEMFSELVSEIFVGKYKPMHWKKQGSNFRLITDDGLGKIINFQKSKWSTSDVCDFYINYGLYIELEKEIHNESFFEYECQLRNRTSFLKGEYSITKETDLIELKNSVLTALEETDTLFDNVKTKDDLIKILLKGESEYSINHVNLLNYHTCLLLYKMGYGREIYEKIKDSNSVCFKRLLSVIEQENGINRETNQIVSINENQLNDLIDRMDNKEVFHRSDESISFQAHREAEKINDPAAFPILIKIINDKKTKKKIREHAYYIIGKVLVNSFDEEACSFLVNQLSVETDKDILEIILDSMEDYYLPKGIDVTPIVNCSKSDICQVRHSAIRALGSSSTQISKNALDYYLNQDDEKKYKEEIILAIRSYGSIGDESDIPRIEKYKKSMNLNIRVAFDSACRNYRFCFRGSNPCKCKYSNDNS